MSSKRYNFVLGLDNEWYMIPTEKRNQWDRMIDLATSMDRKELYDSVVEEMERIFSNYYMGPIIEDISFESPSNY